jgi:hypothetical protein
MKASTIMLVAIVALVLGRWANNEDAIPSPKAVVEAIFAIVVIALLDEGKTEPVAKGFAWLFLAAALLGKNSILTSLSKVSSKAVTTPKAS